MPSESLGGGAPSVLTAEQVAAMRLRPARDIDGGSVSHLNYHIVSLCDSHEALRAEVTALRAERDAAQQDTKRLDWLEKMKPNVMYSWDDEAPETDVQVRLCHRLSGRDMGAGDRYYAIREAVDDAASQEKFDDEILDRFGCGQGAEGVRKTSGREADVLPVSRWPDGTARSGTPNPSSPNATPQFRPCAARSPDGRYYCTELIGHAGEHVACGMNGNEWARWPSPSAATAEEQK